jgi:hypothetical protein
MDASTDVKGMLSRKKIQGSNYQRAYSRDTSSSSFYGKTPTDVFLEYLENRISSGVATPYCFGHFLFADKGNDIFESSMASSV